MELKYDITTYLTSIRMSAKIRILVEGRDDKSHLSNIIPKLCSDKKIKIDTASEIKGDCPSTAKNNRAKVEKLHKLSQSDRAYKNIFFLCDRETRGFNINNKLENLIRGHHVDGSLSWTLGHSIENYFLAPELLSNALRYLTSSAHKSEAIILFNEVFEQSIRLITCLTIAAQQLKSTSLPCGIVSWKDFTITNNAEKKSIEISYPKIKHHLSHKLEAEHRSVENLVSNSNIEDCVLLCRGHTALVMLQRIFSACIFICANAAGSASPERDANLFSSLDEKHIAAAFSEAWIKSVESGSALYPEPLITSIRSA